MSPQVFASWTKYEMKICLRHSVFFYSRKIPLSKYHIFITFLYLTAVFLVLNSMKCKYAYVTWSSSVVERFPWANATFIYFAALFLVLNSMKCKYAYVTWSSSVVERFLWANAWRLTLIGTVVERSIDAPFSRWTLLCHKKKLKNVNTRLLIY